jgi:hypothetical protein
VENLEEKVRECLKNNILYKEFFNRVLDKVNKSLKSEDEKE